MKKIPNNKNDKNLSIGQLAKISGLRYSTIKYYTEVGILPFEQEEKNLRRKYNEINSLKRLEKIKELKEKKRYTISEIIEYFNRLED